MLIAVNFHYVRPVFDAPHPGIYGITPAQLEAQLTLLSRAGVFVSAAQIRDALHGIGALPERAIVITFDDGLREQYDHAWPVLCRLGVPAIFFANTAPIQRATISTVHKIHLLRAYVAPGEFLHMLQRHAQVQGLALGVAVDQGQASFHYKYDSAEVAQLKYLLNFLLQPEARDRLIEACFHEVFPGQEAAMSRALYFDVAALSELGAHDCLGTHAHEHLPLGLLPVESVRDDLRQAVACLARWGGRAPFALSYPYGSQAACSPVVAELAAAAGIEFAFTMERAGNADLHRPLFLARFDNNDVPGGKAARWAVEEFFAAVPQASWHRA